MKRPIAGQVKPQVTMTAKNITEKRKKNANEEKRENKLEEKKNRKKRERTQIHS